MFTLLLTDKAKGQFDALKDNAALKKRHKSVGKAIALLQQNPRHPGLNTHKYHGSFGPNGEELFEAYAENNTPQAYRIFWHYGPGKKTITIAAITPHP